VDPYAEEPYPPPGEGDLVTTWVYGCQEVGDLTVGVMGLLLLLLLLRISLLLLLLRLLLLAIVCLPLALSTVARLLYGGRWLLHIPWLLCSSGR
jgi:hypothetical protein